MHLPTVEPADVAGGGFDLVVDVREVGEWAAGRAPGTVHVPMSELPDRLGELPRDGRLAVVCRVGARSAQVVAFLRQQGYEAVNVRGGLLAWEHEGLPLEGVVV